MLESILGTEDNDRIGLVEGSVLRRVDNSLHYEPDSTYLVFPPSHSYLITSATGWIKLKNNSPLDAGEGAASVPLELLSWPRKGERVVGRFTLPPGHEEVFDFRVFSYSPSSSASAHSRTDGHIRDGGVSRYEATRPSWRCQALTRWAVEVTATNLACTMTVSFEPALSST